MAVYDLYIKSSLLINLKRYRKIKIYSFFFNEEVCQHNKKLFHEGKWLSLPVLGGSQAVHPLIKASLGLQCGLKVKGWLLE